MEQVEIHVIDKFGVLVKTAGPVSLEAGNAISLIHGGFNIEIAITALAPPYGKKEA